MRLSQELMRFMKEKNCNPFKNMLVPLAQVITKKSLDIIWTFSKFKEWWNFIWHLFFRVSFKAPIFISVFLGLRKMVEIPVDSLKEGGLWWFKDLTVPDPYYILPLVTMATLALTVEVGTDTARAKAMGMLKYVMRAMPVIIFPFTINFSGVRISNDSFPREF